MPTLKPPIELTEATRREVFFSLVEAQDRRMTVLQSREKVSRHFRITIQAVMRIEREGLDAQWPPLS